MCCCWCPQIWLETIRSETNLVLIFKISLTVDFESSVKLADYRRVCIGY